MAVLPKVVAIAQSSCSWRDSAFVPETWHISALLISSGRSARCGSQGRAVIKFGCLSRRRFGEAILDYIECRPPVRGSDHVFVRNIAPFRPFVRGDGVSNLVRRAMKRAGIVAPAKGAHVLRHTVATEMLRHDVPLDRIALVLRHRGIDTTAYYAKVDVNLLKQIAQPWPEILP